MAEDKKQDAKLKQLKLMREECEKDEDVKGFPKKQKWFLFLLKVKLGNILQACQIAGISRQTVYDWKSGKQLPAWKERFTAKVAEINDISIDFVESKLFDNIKAGDVASILFYLKTRAKDRGYIEKSEVDHTSKGEKINNTPMMFVSADQLTPEQLQDYIAKNLNGANSNNEGT